MAPHRLSTIVVLVLIGILFCSDVIRFAQGATVTIMKENHITAVEGSGEARHLRGEDVSAIEMPNNDDDTTMNLQGGSIGPLQSITRSGEVVNVCPKLGAMEVPSTQGDGCYSGGYFFSGFTGSVLSYKSTCSIDGTISLYSSGLCEDPNKIAQGPGFCYNHISVYEFSVVNMCCGIGCLDEIPLK